MLFFGLGSDSGPTMAFVCTAINFGETPPILDELLWFCIDKTEKQLDLLHLSVKYQNMKNITLVLQKFIEMSFSRNSSQHDIGWGTEGGDFACHSGCAYTPARPLPATLTGKPTGSNSHLQCQCCDGPMAQVSPAEGIWAGAAALCCLPYPTLEAAGRI